MPRVARASRTPPAVALHAFLATVLARCAIQITLVGETHQGEALVPFVACRGVTKRDSKAQNSA